MFLSREIPLRLDNMIYRHSVHGRRRRGSMIDQATTNTETHPDSKIHGANMSPTWGRQDPGGPHDGHAREPCYLGYAVTHMIWTIDVGSELLNEIHVKLYVR